MKSHEHRYAVIVVPLIAKLAERGGRLQERLGRHSAQRAQHFRLDQSDLLEKIRQTFIHLRRLGVAIIRWPAFEHVGYVDFFSRKLDRRQNFVQKLPGRPDKRLPLEIFLSPRSFADEHQPGMRIPDTVNEFVPSRPERTFLAFVDRPTVGVNRAKAWFTQYRMNTRRRRYRAKQTSLADRRRRADNNRFWLSGRKRVSRLRSGQDHFVCPKLDLGFESLTKHPENIIGAGHLCLLRYSRFGIQK